MKPLREPRHFITKSKCQTFSGTDDRAGYQELGIPKTNETSPCSRQPLAGGNSREAAERQHASRCGQVRPVVRTAGEPSSGTQAPYLTPREKVNTEQLMGQEAGKG